MSRQVELLVDAHASLGEGPCWDARENVLWWVDILQQTLYRFDPNSGTSKSFQFDRSVSVAIPRSAGGLVVALRDGFYAFDPATLGRELIAEVAPGPDFRLNDAKCDSSGRLWGGTVHADELSGVSAFYRVDPTGRVEQIWDGVTCSNGIGWSPDDRLMYYVDSGAHRIDVCDYDSSSGRVENRRTLAEIAVEDGEPDGLTVDSAGFVWVALWAGGALRRYGPNGRLEEVIPIPAHNVTSCTFGGDDLETLYVTTALSKTPPEQLRRHPRTGSLFQLRPGVKGLPTNPYTVEPEHQGFGASD